MRYTVHNEALELVVKLAQQQVGASARLRDGQQLRHLSGHRSSPAWPEPKSIGPSSVGFSEAVNPASRIPR